MNYKDYYKTLGIDKNATEKEIKKAYRKLANEHHPDKNQGNKVSEEKFKEINEAYEVLKDPEKRKKYEQLGANWEAYQKTGYDASQERGNPFGQGGGSRTYTFQGDPSEFFGAAGGDSSGYSSFFEQFFGGQFGGGEQFNSGGGRQHRAAKGRDIQAVMDISLEDAYHGSSKIFELNGQHLRIKIKPGAFDDQTLRLNGKGNPGAGGGQAGDLYLTLRLVPHSVFQRTGDDLLIEKTIDLYTAILGGKITVSTMAGDINLTIPKGTSPGKKLRLKGKGMPLYNTPDKYGDLIIVINVQFPNHLSPEQEALFEKLREIEHEMA